MPFVRTWSELRTAHRSGAFLSQFTGAEMLSVTFSTDPELVATILPRPLRPADEPVAYAFVARYPATNFGVSYAEGALFLAARYKGETGLYCLAMPVDDDTALIGGREQFGFPKKMADEITLQRDGPHIVGSVIRNGTEVLRIEGEFVDPAPDDPRPLAVPAVDLEGQPCFKLVSFLFRHFPAPGGSPVDRAPQLVRQVTLLRPRAGHLTGAAKLDLTTTTTDPLGEIPVRRIIASRYGIFDNTMLPGRVVAHVYNRWRFIPKSTFKNDALALIDFNALPALSLGERNRQRRQLRSY